GGGVWGGAGRFECGCDRGGWTGGCMVASMARPGGNLTGFTLSVGYELVAKRVELLKDIKPALARLAILRNPANPSAGSYLSEAEKAGRALGLTMRAFDARSPSDLEGTFAAMIEW